MGAKSGYQPITWTFTCFVLGERLCLFKRKVKALVWCLGGSSGRSDQGINIYSQDLAQGLTFGKPLFRLISTLICMFTTCCEIHKFETSPSLSALPGGGLGARSTGSLAALSKMSNTVNCYLWIGKIG